MQEKKKSVSNDRYPFRYNHMYTDQSRLWPMIS